MSATLKFLLGGRYGGCIGIGGIMVVVIVVVVIVVVVMVWYWW